MNATNTPYRSPRALLSLPGTRTYRAIRAADSLPVLIKVLDSRSRQPRDRERLLNEYEVARTLKGEAVVRPLELTTYEDLPALVSEDCGGEPLETLLGRPMDPERFLLMAIRIAAATSELHDQDVVHGDLQPQHIFVDPTSNTVKLAGFGIAIRCAVDVRPPQAHALIEGSLPYMSPEQTGRMNRAIDQRTDLYSLGVTFYQMLTGQLPFQAHDPLEWVHCHIARAPPPPTELEPAIPAVLSSIVMKLLAKMADDRYQSAAGLRYDLERCLEAWERTGSLPPFPLGTRDRSSRFQVRHRLYGREKEIARLIETFERVANTGAPELVMVSGYPGIGKSALVNELGRSIVQAHGFFISGKFDQFKRNIPYSTVVQAFRELILEILTLSESQVDAWRQRIQGALGINGQLIVDVIPQVELLIHKQPPVPELPPTEALNRFRIVLREFVGAFCRQEHPLVLFLDDLQWADTASLELIRDLVTHTDVRFLLIISAHRDNEVSVSHPLALALANQQRAGVHLEHIVLGPLSLEDLSKLVADTLHRDPAEVAPLASLVFEKTAGNPFFSIQFLNTLHDERLLELDRASGTWQWKLEQIRAKGFTDNVIDLMLAKLARLPASTREVVKLAACVGNISEVAILTLICRRSEEELQADLLEAIRGGLILRTDRTYRFVHDRIQEAAYSLIEEHQRAAVHLKIGRLLLEKLTPPEIDDQLFDVVGQLNRGAALMTDPGEKERLERLNFLAGQRAKASIAYDSARSYLARATGLLPADAWTVRYEHTFALYLERAECEYLAGHFPVADALFDAILEKARSRLDRAKVHSLRMRVYQVEGKYDQGVTVALEALELFGVTFPESDEEIQAATEAERREIARNLGDRRIVDLLEAPVVTDPDVRAIICLLVDSEPCAYIGRPKIFLLLALKGVNFSLKYGNTEESCFAYSAYGLALVSLFEDIPAAVQFSEMALRLNEKFQDRRLRGTLLHLHGDHINFWHRPFATDFPILEQAFTACLEVGDLVYAGFLAFETVWQVVERGDPLDEVLRVSSRFAEFARHSHNEAVYQTIRLEQQFVACLKGLTQGPTRFDDLTFDEAACLEALRKATFGCGIVFFHIMKQIAAFTSGQYAEALEAALEAKPVLGAAMAMPIEATHHFYHALTLAALYPQASPERQLEFKATLQQLLGKHRRWAAHCPENYLHRYALVQAEIARLEGRDLEAMRFYDQAVRSAEQNGFFQYQGLANELAAQFYLERGVRRSADLHLGDARAAYEQWGADGKVRQLERAHPPLAKRWPGAPAATFAARQADLDLLSLVKASQVVSRELVVDQLVRTLLAVVLEQSGAQKGYLVLEKEEGALIEAEAAMVGTGGVVAGPVHTAESSRGPLMPVSIANYVKRTRERVILDNAAERAGRFSSDEYIARVKPISVLCMPILRQARMIGLLYLENNLVAGAFSPERLTALELLASQAAISLENAVLLSREQAARVTAEAMERRSAFLAQASKLLAESLEYEEILRRLADLVVHYIADWCVIDLVEDGRVRRLAGAHADPSKAALVSRLMSQFPLRLDSPHPSARVLLTGEPILKNDPTEEELRAVCAGEDHLRLILELGFRSGIGVPLIARGEILGVLTLISSAPTRRYGPADLELAQELARRAAIAMDNARLFRAAQEAIHLRDEFLSIASHELYTPMTSLSITLQAAMRHLASSQPFDPARITRMLELADRQSRRMNRLIRELLDVSRIEQGRLPIERSETELGELVREVLNRLEQDLVRAGCRVSLHQDGPVTGWWARSLIDQVITNLLTNALKFGQGKPIDISVSSSGGVARLTVRDQGIGVDPARQGRVFDRFERAVSAEHYGGLGLGLYISRKIVEAHGGSIGLESRLGEGATFTVELPCGTPPGSGQ